MGNEQYWRKPGSTRHSIYNIISRVSLRAQRDMTTLRLFPAQRIGNPLRGVGLRLKQHTHKYGLIYAAFILFTKGEKN